MNPGYDPRNSADRKPALDTVDFPWTAVIVYDDCIHVAEHLMPESLQTHGEAP